MLLTMDDTSARFAASAAGPLLVDLLRLHGARNRQAAFWLLQVCRCARVHHLSAFMRGLMPHSIVHVCVASVVLNVAPLHSLEVDSNLRRLL